ncbi:tRNA m5C-methyltransferase, putative [Plasmodium vivax]|uniref:NOL1/NOP2/Sun domain family member 4 n=1 Tax=Plasmodium vivax TaxID=5855 RepID=A0A564ZUS3_PLAVI|nr:tRNA m5C-methyltransferase, putative [Plasmodium vivax]
MKCSGKVGYLFNLKREYGEERATTLLRALEEEKAIQGAFITDFVKMDYLNLTKILLFMVGSNKVETSFDGLYVDGAYAHLLTHRGVAVPQGKPPNGVIPSVGEERKEGKCSAGGNSEGVNFEGVNFEEANASGIIFDGANSAGETAGIIFDGVNAAGETAGGGPPLRNPHPAENYEKIIIHKSEILNAEDIMKQDGEVESISKAIYYLNPCSVLSAYFLDVQKDENVLDMCASPGGKSLVIANQLFGYDTSPVKRIKKMEYLQDGSVQITCSLDMVNYYATKRQGFFVANEFNRVRYDRLKQVLGKHLPKDLLTSNRLHLTNYNGLNVNSFLRFPRFHKILLDVPCSTDEHLIKKKKKDLLNKWSDKVIKNNASVQFELLRNSFQLLHTNGILVYSTCALSHHENDQVIEKFLTKYKKQVQVVDFVKEEVQKRFHGDDCGGLFSPSVGGHTCEQRDNEHAQGHSAPRDGPNTHFLSFFEKTKYGYISLPDRSPFGILYICKIRKI